MILKGWHRLLSISFVKRLSDLQNLLIKWKQTFINIYQAPASKFPRSNFYSEASLSSLILSHSQGQLAHCYWVLLPQLAEFLPVLWQKSQISLHSIGHCVWRHLKIHLQNLATIIFAAPTKLPKWSPLPNSSSVTTRIPNMSSWRKKSECTEIFGITL